MYRPAIVVARPSKPTLEEEEVEEEEDQIVRKREREREDGAIPWRKVHAQLHQNGISRRINFRNARLKRPGTAK